MVNMKIWSNLQVLKEDQVGQENLTLIVKSSLSGDDICSLIHIYNSHDPWNIGILADLVFQADKRLTAVH